MFAKDLSSSTDRIPHPIGSPVAAFDAAERLIVSLGSKKVLDCPAGQGAFAQRLLDRSIDVECCDIRPAEFRLSGVRCRPCDLNERIPYEDGEFDTVVCLNGLHRIWARGRALSEFARVLQPAGHVIITVPNASNLMRRLSFMTTGVSVPNTVGPPHAFQPDASDPAGHVRVALTIPEVHQTLQAAGLRLVQVTSVVLSKRSLLLAPLALGALALAPYARKRLGLPPCPQVNSMAGLLSERVLLLAQKL